MGYYERFLDVASLLKLRWSCPKCIDIGHHHGYNYGVDLEGDPTYVLGVMVPFSDYDAALEHVTKSTMIKDYWEF